MYMHMPATGGGITKLFLELDPHQWLAISHHARKICIMLLVIQVDSNCL